MKVKEIIENVIIAIFTLLIMVFYQIIKEPTIGLVYYILYLGYVFYRHNKFFLTYFYLIIYLFTNVFGIFLIESRNMFLPEMFQVSSNVHSLIPMVAIHILFIQIMLIVFEKKSTTETYDRGSNDFLFNKKIMTLLIMFQFLILFVAFFRIIRYPAVFIGMDRFIYAKQYLPGIWSRISTFATVFLPLDLMYYMKFKKKFGLFVILFYLIYLFWIGTKFGMYLISIYWLVIPLVKKLNKKMVKKVTISFFVLIFLLLGIVTLQGKLIYNRVGDQNTDYLVNRIAQQGQMWWATYKDYKGQMHIDETGDETRTFFNSKLPDDKNYGIYKLMMHEIPSSTFYNKVYIGGARYAFSTDASVYYYFNFIGLIIWTIVMGIFYSWIVKRYIDSFLNFRIISCLCFTKMFLSMNSILLQSDFNKLFSYETVILLIVVFGIDIFYEKMGGINYGVRSSRNRMQS